MDKNRSENEISQCISFHIILTMYMYHLPKNSKLKLGVEERHHLQ